MVIENNFICTCDGLEDAQTLTMILGWDKWESHAYIKSIDLSSDRKEKRRMDGKNNILWYILLGNWGQLNAPK